MGVENLEDIEGLKGPEPVRNVKNPDVDAENVEKAGHKEVVLVH